MGSDTQTLESLCSLIVDCPHSTPVWTDSGFVVLRNQNIKNGRLDLSSPSFTDEEHFAARNRRAKPTLGDIVITREAPMGDVCMVPQGLECCLGQRQVLLRPNPSLINPRFLHFALQSAAVQDQIAWSEGTGSTVSNLRIPVLKALGIPTPPRVAQDLIASALGALDDRIDLLRQTNATLEAIAQALFKSWFVDFDPVRAKADGREPEGMDAETAALFPSEFEESELGLIPRGWRVACLEEHIEAERGLSYKGAGLSDEDAGLPMHNLNSVLEGGGYKYAGIKFYKEAFKERHIARAGDLVVANTEQGHHHRLIGFPAIVPRRYQRGLFSHHLYRVRVRNDSPVTGHWIYRSLMTPSVRDQIIGCANGSTVNMLKPAGLQIPRFVLPPVSLCERFEKLAIALNERIETNVDLVSSVTAIRDTLLPRLISGKLRLPEADITVKESLA